MRGVEAAFGLGTSSPPAALRSLSALTSFACARASRVSTRAIIASKRAASGWMRCDDSGWPSPRRRAAGSGIGKRVDRGATVESGGMDGSERRTMSRGKSIVGPSPMGCGFCTTATIHPACGPTTCTLERRRTMLATWWGAGEAGLDRRPARPTRPPFSLRRSSETSADGFRLASNTGQSVVTLGSVKRQFVAPHFGRHGAMLSDTILVAGPTPWGRDCPWSPA